MKGAAGELVVEEARGIVALAGLEAEWRALHASSPEVPFLSFEWNAAFAARLLGTRTPRILCARQGGQLVGLLPLAETELRPFGLRPAVRRLSFLVERWTGADYLGLLVAPGRFAEVAPAIAERLFAGKSFDVLELDGLAADSPFLPQLLLRIQTTPGLLPSLSPRHLCPQLSLQGSWRDQLKRSSRGENFRRRLRQLRALSGFERRVVVAPGEIGAALERFLDLHRARWASDGGSDAMARPAVQAFHRHAVAGLAARGAVRFEELWVEGACRASLYGLEAGETFAYYQTGFDPAWAGRSVGLVLLALSIEEALARGFKRYDFLRGTESYKFDWADDVRSTVALRVAVPGVEAALLASRVQGELLARRAAHAFLPGRAVTLLRQLRKVLERRE